MVCVSHLQSTKGRCTRGVLCVPTSPPTAPLQVELDLVAGSATSLTVYWVHPSTDNAAIVTHYVVEWAKSSVFDEVQSNRDLATVFDANCARIGSETIYQYAMENLDPGSTYYVRVRAENEMGYGPPAAANLSFLVVHSAADQITHCDVRLSTVDADEVTSVLDSSTQLRVTWNMPFSNQGAVISEYKIEWYIADGTHETEEIHIKYDTSGMGTFTIAYDGSESDHLPYDLSEAGMQTALLGLSSLRDVHVEKEAGNSVDYDFRWLVTFYSEYPATESKK